jgi:hypothetical protein
MYSLNMPVSRLRTKMRQEFERHRYVSQLPTVDVLLSKSQMEYQVCSLDHRGSQALGKLASGWNWWGWTTREC